MSPGRVPNHKPYSMWHHLSDALWDFSAHWRGCGLKMIKYSNAGTMRLFTFLRICLFAFSLNTFKNHKWFPEIFKWAWKQENRVFIISKKKSRRMNLFVLNCLVPFACLKKTMAKSTCAENLSNKQILLPWGNKYWLRLHTSDRREKAI